MGIPLLILAAASAVGEPSVEVVRARAALAMAFADRGPTYASKLAEAKRRGVPLVVWVGVPAKPMTDAVCYECDVFPSVSGAAVVVGIPTGETVKRIDLPPTASVDRVRAALK